MSEIDQADALARSYSRLISLRDSLKGIGDSTVAEWYVTEFHGALDRLRDAGVDVAEFRLPPAAMQRAASYNYLTGASTDLGKPYVERALLLAKCGAVVSYFEMSPDEPKRPIGFRP